MISVDEAKKIVHENTRALTPVTRPLEGAAGLVLAEDVYAHMDIPGFRQSSMDGYALSFDDWKTNPQLTISGEIAAGSPNDTPLKPGHAVRIFTGAPVPPGADTVVMQEKARVENGMLIIEDGRLTGGANVRAANGEISAGMLALPKGHLLTPAAMGFLIGIGVTQVTVYPRPLVSIIVTGDELEQPGEPLRYGQVYESNSRVLRAALEQLHIGDVRVLYAEDSLDVLRTVLAGALEDSDLVFLTGGISVGDYDFVLQATIDNGVTQLFHRIKQRPAKPLYFGKKGARYVFGLPGNPASGLTSFYEYVLPALEIMTQRNSSLRVLKAPLASPFQKSAGLTHFLKGVYDGRTALVLGGQESFRLSSFARANCLIQVDEAVTHCAAGEMVEVHLLPGS